MLIIIIILKLFLTVVPIRIVPAPGLGIPDFTILESNGPQQVCVEIQNPFGQDHLEKSVFVTLSTADGTATSKSSHSTLFSLFICSNLKIIPQYLIRN